MQLKHWTLVGLFLAGSLWAAVSFSFGAPLSGGTERDKADWSRVQAVSPETKTEVQLSEDKVSLDQETHGRFYSATDNSLTLRFEDGELNTFQKPDIEKVLTYRPVSERWAGWATLAVSSIIVAILLRGDTEGAPLVLLPFVAAPTAIAFYGSASMKEVYELPSNHGDWYPQRTGVGSVQDGRSTTADEGGKAHLPSSPE